MKFQQSFKISLPNLRASSRAELSVAGTSGVLLLEETVAANELKRNFVEIEVFEPSIEVAGEYIAIVLVAEEFGQQRTVSERHLLHLKPRSSGSDYPDYPGINFS